MPASLAKGLEFDHVVLVEPAAIVAGEPDQVTGLRRLYVCLTRAVTSLVVLHELAPPDGAFAGSMKMWSWGTAGHWRGCDALRDELVAAYCHADAAATTTRGT